MMEVQDWSWPEARIGYGTTKSEDPFSALILFRLRSSFGGGPRSPARPPLVFPGKLPWLQASPDRRCDVGALLRRQWLLDAGVVGETTSGLFKFPVLDASATPERCIKVRWGRPFLNINILCRVISRFVISAFICHDQRN